MKSRFEAQSGFGPQAGRSVRFATSAQAAERIAAALELADHPPEAIGIFAMRDGRFEVSAYYRPEAESAAIEGLITAAAAGEAIASLCIAPLADEDWVTLSQGQRGPVHAGRFFIHGSHTRNSRHLLAIEIDAAQAFGTAHHGSTLGCLLALDHLLKRRRFARALDLGTGTGILAIAATRVQRRKAMASDSDPIAVATARENARNNEVGSLVGVVQAAGLAHPRLRRAQFDLVLANLLMGPLLELAPHLAWALAPRGIAVLSGITNAQSRAVEARYRSLGFMLKSRIILDGWTTLVLGRRNQRPRRLIAGEPQPTKQGHVSKFR
jgi:ribosomal protein L11 methyltransferase